ncbi:MAG: hypothetical protein ACFN4E_11810, partial [Corynebacterium matruchotii]
MRSQVVRSKRDDPGHPADLRRVFIRPPYLGFFHEFFGVQKHDLPSKMFGVFRHTMNEPFLPIFRGFD